MSHEFPQRSTEPEPVVVEIEHVPTLAELEERGRVDGVKYVVVISYSAKGSAAYRLADAGHALLGEIMRRNGRALAAAEGARPPVSARPALTPAQAAYLWARDAFDDSP